MLVLVLEAIGKYLLSSLISSKVPDCRNVTLIKSNSFSDNFQRFWAKTSSVMVCGTGFWKTQSMPASLWNCNKVKTDK